MSDDFQETTEAEQAAILETAQREKIALWWQIAGIEPHYPATTDTVVRLLRAVEYAVDSDELLAWAQSEVIPPVPRVKSRLAWSAIHVVCAAGAAEIRRRWKPFSTIHAHKLTMAERINQVCELEGKHAFNDLAQYDLPGLLGILHQVAGDKGATETIAVALQIKLKQLGAL